MPGTGLARDFPSAARLAWNTIARPFSALPFASTPKRSARHLVRLAVGADAVPTGSHLRHGRIAATSEASYDEERRRRLYDDSVNCHGLKSVACRSCPPSAAVYRQH
ncbi:hypothetical protein [Glycomyces halotolerans]